MTFLTTRQACEVGRLADRCGPLAICQLSRGRIAVGISTAPGAIPSLLLALDDHGRVAAHRRINRGADLAP